MYEANKEIIEDYYEYIKDTTIKTFYDVYFNKNFQFRGARHV
jgi:hypothetical protein